MQVMGDSSGNIHQLTCEYNTEIVPNVNYDSIVPLVFPDEDVYVNNSIDNDNLMDDDAPLSTLGIYMCTYACMCMSVCICVHIYTYVCIFMHICLFLCMHG